MIESPIGVVEPEQQCFDHPREHRVAIGYVALGVAVTITVLTCRPEQPQDLDRVYVEDESVGGTSPVA